jgi:hypothetical protein
MINHDHINRKVVIAATPSKNAATPNTMPIIRSSFMDHGHMSLGAFGRTRRRPCTNTIPQRRQSS